MYKIHSVSTRTLVLFGVGLFVTFDKGHAIMFFGLSARLLLAPVMAVIN